MQGLLIPSFASTQNPDLVLTNAFGVVAGSYMEILAGSGRVTMDIFPSVASFNAGRPQVDQLSIAFGQVYTPGNPNANPPVPDVRAPTFAEFLALVPAGATAPNASVQTAWNILAAAFIGVFMGHPKLKGASVVDSNARPTTV